MIIQNIIPNCDAVKSVSGENVQVTLAMYQEFGAQIIGPHKTDGFYKAYSPYGRKPCVIELSGKRRLIHIGKNGKPTTAIPLLGVIGDFVPGIHGVETAAASYLNKRIAKATEPALSIEAMQDLVGAKVQEEKKSHLQAQGSEIPKEISYISMAELSLEDHVDVPIIKDFAHEEDITMIHAAGGVGKTTIIQNMLVTAGAYTPPLIPGDKDLLWGKFDIMQECLSIIVQSEMSRRFASIRMKKMVEGNPQLIRGANNVIMPLVDGNVTVTGDVDKPEFITWLEKLIDRVEEDRQQKVNFMAFDPLISFHDKDENSSELRRSLDKLRKVFEKSNTILLFTHHDNKNEKTYRGTTAIWDFCRNVIHIELAKVGNVNTLKFTNDKCNHRLPFKDFHLLRDEHLNFECITNLDSLSDAQVKRCRLLQSIFDEAGKAAMTFTALKDLYRGKENATPTTAKRHITEAEKHGFIKKIIDPNSTKDRDKYIYVKNPKQP